MKTIGILGGMGPLATEDLYHKLIVHTDALKDAEHAHIIIDSNAQTPDRTAAILKGETDPGDALVSMAQNLKNAGADVLIIACNTAHYWYDRIAEAVDVPVLHMPRLTAAFAKEKGYKKVALLATTGTYAAQVYSKAFAENGTELLLPDTEGKNTVMSLIYDGVKAGRKDYDTAKFLALLNKMQAEGAESFILGCTELPVAFSQYAIPFPSIDPTLVLALAALKEAGVKIK